MSEPDYELISKPALAELNARADAAEVELDRLRQHMLDPATPPPAQCATGCEICDIWNATGPDAMHHDGGYLAGREESRAAADSLRDKLHAATARAERAEAAEADLRAALRRVRVLHIGVEDNTAPKLGFTAPDLCLADGDTWPCPTIAAVDSTDPVEAAPEPGPIERSRELARAEVELIQRWWVRDAQGYRYRMAGPQAAAEAKVKGFGGAPSAELTVCYDFEFRRSSSRFFDAPPFPGTHPDVPAPGRSAEEKP